MQLYVTGEPSDWGNAQLNDIEKVLKDTASHLNRLLRNPFKGTIHVIPSEEGFPRVCMRESPDQPFFLIKLSARDRKWDDFAYEFSHEFCHVLSDFEKLEPELNQVKPNNWFHESICELASVFTLRRMAERWPTNPPYPNWADYAEKLEYYSQRKLSRPEVKLAEGVTLQAWSSLHETVLQQHRYCRDKNALVAYKLLPIFESDPKGWNAIQSLPDYSGSLEEYFVEWHSVAHPADKGFIARLSNEFGYTIRCP